MAPKLKTAAMTVARMLAILMGWLLIIVLYLGVYDLLERRAVPVAAGGKTFWATNWDRGYFFAEGSLSNDDASTPGDDLVFGTTKITCIRDRLTCSISTADVHDGFLTRLIREAWRIRPRSGSRALALGF